MSKKKLAIFVEGQTERILITRLLQEIAGYKKVSVESTVLPSANIQ